MMLSLPTATMGAALGAIILAGAFVYLRRFDKLPALTWWAAAMIINAVRLSLDAATVGTASPVITLLAHACCLAAAASFLVGTLRFLGEPRFGGLIVGLALAGAAWTAFASLAGVPIFWRQLPPALLGGAALITAAAAFSGAREASHGRGYGPMSVLFALWGIAVAAWPLADGNDLLPLAALVDQALTLASAICLIVVLQRRHSEALHGANRRIEESAFGLAEAERRFRDFAEVSSDWMWELDPDLRFTFVSENLRRTLGIAPEASLGKRPNEVLYSQRDPERLQAHFADLDARRPFRDFGFWSSLPDGREFYLVVSGKPRFDHNGQFLGYRGIGRDGTAEKDATERADAARQQLSDAFQALDNAIALFDRDDRMIVCNPAYREFTQLEETVLKPGVTFEEIIRTRIARGLLRIPGNQPVETFVAERLDQHRNPRGPIERERANNEWSLLTEQKLSDGGIVLVIYDITAAKRRERELAEKTQLLQSTLENMGEGISVYDANLRMVAWNEKLIEMVGHPRELYRVGTPFEDIVRFSAEHGEYGLGSIEEHIRERVAASTAGPHRNARWRISGRYVELRRNPMPGGGFVTVYSDLTERKRGEDALRQAKEAAEAANRTKSEILANMSHELRTPLNAIIGFSDIILRESFGPVGQKRYLDYARDIYESGTHLLALINDILDVSKAEAGRIELLEGRVDIVELLDSCIRLVHARADEGRIELRCTIADHLPALHADGLRLKQVLLNLLSNAIKFTPAGGAVTLTADRAGSGLVLRVSDTGIGIAPEDIPKALSPFGQIETAHARRYPGTGLGLPLSKALVELHGGLLHIESEVGRGTTVSVTLPAARLMAA